MNLKPEIPEQEKIFFIVFGIIFVLMTAMAVYESPSFIRRMADYFSNETYDWQVRNAYKPITPNCPILIVDIDDHSLALEGRWPWPRKKLALLVDKLAAQGAKVIALDVTFPESEASQASELIQALEKKPSNLSVDEIKKIESDIDVNAQFAKSLAATTSILGYVLQNQKIEVNTLPPPLLELTKEQGEALYIEEKMGYLSNIPILQKAGKGFGFIDSSPDQDGTIRYAPLLLRYGRSIYPSLALEAAATFLESKFLELVTQKYGDSEILEGIKYDQMMIPTNPYGQILVPFRGPPYSIPYVAAVDVLNNSIPKETIANKLIFIGSTATAIGDLFATSMAPVFAGVEIQATIAAGIIDNYLPRRPAWGKGLSIFLILILGIFFAVLFPNMGVFWSLFWFIPVPFIILGFSYWLWAAKGLALSLDFPIITLTTLYVFNETFGFFFEGRQRKRMKAIFGAYIPSERIDLLMKRKEGELDGKSKNLTVLFADIRKFTTISEGFSPAQLKGFLNIYLTAMTKEVFNTKGTIDKYVGDMIMAFWGDPIDDPNHAADGAICALNMQKRLKDLNEKFAKENKPAIEIGIGINTGQMSVGDMGSEYRLAYTVLGDSVNLASRLEGLTKQYHVKIMVGEDTYKETSSSFVYRKLDKVKVKGKHRSVVVYELISNINELSKEQAAFLDLFHQALDLYFQRKWDESENLFKNLIASDPDKKNLYSIYLERIHAMKASPPPDDWDGTYTHETK